MIVLLTAPGHRYTLKGLKSRGLELRLPQLIIVSYDWLFRLPVVPRATYLFTDFNRLSPWEHRVAAERFRTFSRAGLRCLNDPAKIPDRVQLTAALHEAGQIPYRAYRATDRPRPVRFPVFVRLDDHQKPLTDLLGDQAALDERLQSLQSEGIPLRDLLVIEYCGEPIREGLWAKWGAFRVGEQYSLDHIGVEPRWLVKYGDWNLLSEDIVALEHTAVTRNQFEADLMSGFALAQIEYGRADFGLVNGRPVIYEINTNPFVGPYVPDPIPLRRKSQDLARRRLIDMLVAIDTQPRGLLRIGRSPLLDRRQLWRPGLQSHKQP